MLMIIHLGVEVNILLSHGVRVVKRHNNRGYRFSAGITL